MATTEVDYWSDKRDSLYRDQLGTIQKSAAGWTTLFGAVLGVFGTVSFAGGLTTVDKLADPYQFPIRILTLIAAALMLGATVFCGLAANAFPQKLAGAAWRDFRSATLARASVAYLQLQRGIYCAIGAAILVIVGSAIVLILGEASPAAKVPSVLVVSESGAVCGKLEKSAAGQPQISGQPIPSGSVTVVAACP